MVYLTIFFIPAYLLRFEVFGIPTNALEVLVGIAFLWWGIKKFQIPNSKSQTNSKSKFTKFKKFWSFDNWDFGFVWKLEIGNWKLKTGITLLLFGLALGTFASPDIKTSLGALKSWFIVPMLFAFAAGSTLQSRDQKEKAFWSLALSGIAVAVVAMGYWFKGVLTFDGRLAAFYESPNMLAMYIAPALLIVAQALTYDLRLTTYNKRLINKSLVVGFSFLVFSLVMTRSIGAIVGIVGAAIIYLSIERWGKHREKLWKIIFIIIFCASLTLPFSSLFFNPWAMGRSSLVSRVMVWQVSLAILKDHWLFGIGPGAFQDVYLAYQKQFPPYLEWAMPHPHNIFLAAWLYGGLLGIVGFFLILYWFFTRALKKDIVSSCVLLILLYLLLHGIIDNTLWRNDVAQIFYLTLLTGFDIRKGH